jgi:hypothetical protein
MAARDLSLDRSLMMQEVPAHLEETLHAANSQPSTPFAWQALETVRSFEVELGRQSNSENSFDSRSHIITQFHSPLSCSLYGPAQQEFVQLRVRH